MIMRKTKFCLLFLIIFLTACSANTANNTNNLEDNSNKPSQTSIQNNDDSTKEKQVSSNDRMKENSEDNAKGKSETNNKDRANSEQNITEKVKNYILSGQENKSEAQKIKWSKTFLDKVDIESLYKKYIDSGGKGDNVENFAIYMTKNAPVLSNWKELFEKDLYDNYGEKVARLEPLGNDLYQAYVIKEGKEVPYVVVSARTGYFHG